MRNKKTMIILLILMSIVCLLGTSYALLRSSQIGENSYVMSVGYLNVVFLDSETNELILENAYPVRDDEGMLNQDELSFVVKNTGDFYTKYSVYIEETSTDFEFKNVIRYVVNKNDSGYSEPKTLSEDNYIDKNSYIARDEEVFYKIKFWLSIDAESIYMDKKFSARIVVVSEQSDLEEINKNNAPNLNEGMIPVKYNEVTKKWVVCEAIDEDWYDYSEKKWANVMLGDGAFTPETAVVGTELSEDELGSMFVWIPRYAYRITSGYHSSNGTIDVIFLEGTGNSYIDYNGYIKTAKNGNVVGVTSETDYIIHPAFTDGSSNSYSNGEWKKEVDGIWASKFEAGIYTTENDISTKVTDEISLAYGYYYPVFKGRKMAYNNLSFQESYDISLAIDDKNNPYGLAETVNSHLMKNSEWGAVAYLSTSKYGYSNGSSNGEISVNSLTVVNHNSMSESPVSNPNDSTKKLNAVTGYSSGSYDSKENVMSYVSPSSLIDIIEGSSGYSYAWNHTDNNSISGLGTTSSTTGNIYGVYDMNGCLSEYTASYIYASNITELSNVYFATGTSTYLSTAYPSKKASTGLVDWNSSYPLFTNIFGDGIYEISSNVGTGLAWFKNTIEDDSNTTDNEVLALRGGRWYDGFRDDTNTRTFNGLFGIFDSRSGSGYSGFHVVIIPE